MQSKYFYGVLLLGCLIMQCCQQRGSAPDIEFWKRQIEQTEKDFNDMAQAEGLPRAFEYYAAPDGVIRRGKNVIKGKQAIFDWYTNDIKSGETLTWSPTYIDVSSSGDLGYTYGDFIFTYPDSTGSLKTNKGIFHTVWKRQSDGTWRFVWD